VVEEIKDFVQEEYSAVNGTDSEDEDEEEDDELTVLLLDDLDGIPDDLVPEAGGNEAGDSPEPHANEHHGFPRVARCRANLTALSKQYNVGSYDQAIIQSLLSS
jgi:hypothetical protein